MVEIWNPCSRRRVRKGFQCDFFHLENIQDREPCILCNKSFLCLEGVCVHKQYVLWPGGGLFLGQPPENYFALRMYVCLKCYHFEYTSLPVCLQKLKLSFCVIQIKFSQFVCQLLASDFPMEPNAGPRALVPLWQDQVSWGTELPSLSVLLDPH